MIIANIQKDETVHEGDFAINVAINAPIVLSPTDFVFQTVFGDGFTGIVIPEILDISYLEDPVRMVIGIPIEVRENVSGSFRVYMLTKLYTVDNAQYGIAPTAVGLPSTEQQHIACQEKTFYYNTRE